MAQRSRFFYRGKNFYLIVFGLITVALLSSITNRIESSPFRTSDCINRTTFVDEISALKQIRTVKTRNSRAREPEFLPMKTILLWTTYFGEEYSDDYYFFQENTVTFEKYRCPVNKCQVISNRSLYESTAAVLFHAADLNFTDLPPSRKSNQIWILYGLESPTYVRLQWYKVSTLFNWTMTYRLDSNVQVKYGEVRRSDLPSPFCFSSDVLSSKTKEALWLASNCVTQSRREKYIKDLKRHFPVDVYGACGKLKCSPPQSQKCYQNLLRQYKFYLAFENSICKDYVTEKFFNALRYDVIPVVMGGGNYKFIAPPHSFIDASKFPQPKDLAVYLRKVGTNPELYQSYLLWKRHYSVHLHPWMCDLCRLLHESSGKQMTVPRDMWAWWIASSECRRWTRKDGFKTLFKSQKQSPWNL